jgi:hypothetical protein
MVSFPELFLRCWFGTANDEQLWHRGQALCAAYLNVKNRELQLSIETAKPLAFEPFGYILDDRGLADTWGASEQEDMNWRVRFKRCWD